VPVSLRCLDCDSTTTVTDQLLLLCARCGVNQVSVTTGEELLVTSLELAEV
jgi:Zn finger protein HypA/HybF involved in hydrogenase expression